MNVLKLARLFRNVAPHGLRVFFMRVGQFLAPNTFRSVSDISFPSLNGTLWCLRSAGYDPSFVVDIGAYHGEWTRAFKKIYPSAQVVMVEAQEKKRPLLDKVCSELENVSCQTALLGASSGKKVTFCEMETGSSVYEELSSVARTFVEKNLVSLDDLLKEERRPVDFLKLDVQGYELEVLRGAARVMSQAHFVLLEVSVLPYNKSAPLVGDVMRFMGERHFRVFDFCEQMRRGDGFLQQTDILFVREDGPFFEKLLTSRA